MNYKLETVKAENVNTWWKAGDEIGLTFKGTGRPGVWYVKASKVIGTLDPARESR